MRASDLPPIEIAPAITKVGQSVVSPVASVRRGNRREKYERNEYAAAASYVLSLPKLKMDIVASVPKKGEVIRR